MSESEMTRKDKKKKDDTKYHYQEQNREYHYGLKTWQG